MQIFNKTMLIRISEEEEDRLKRVSELTGQSKSEIVRKAIYLYEKYIQAKLNQLKNQ